MSLRRSAYVLSCLLVVAFAACDNNQTAPTTPPPAPAPAPAPAPSPSPAPAPAVSVITGTVTESAPTTATRLAGATVSVGARSVVADGAGSFTIADLAAGTYTLRATKAGYVDVTRTITLPDDAASPISLGLDPEYQSIQKELTNTVSADDGPCPGSHGNFTCFSYPFPAHHAKGIQAYLYWHSSDARLELELRCNEQTWVRTEGIEPQLTEYNREPYFMFRILEDAKKGQMCEIRVLHIKGEAMPFILNVTHPN